MYYLLLRPGVSLEGLKRPIRKAILEINKNYHGLILTSTKGGIHRPDSLHYQGLAFDCAKRCFYIGMPLELEVIKTLLGPDYDVVEELNHFHIEYDPKGGNQCCKISL